MKVEERTRRGFREGPGVCPSIPPWMKAAAQVSSVRGRRRRWHDQRRRLGRRRIVVVDVAEVVAVSVDIDNPGNFYCVKCGKAYDADVAYHHGIHLVKEYRFLSTQNAALALTVDNVLADMDKMKERMKKKKDRADRHWKETSCLEQKLRDKEVKGMPIEWVVIRTSMAHLISD